MTRFTIACVIAGCAASAPPPANSSASSAPPPTCGELGAHLARMEEPAVRQGLLADLRADPEYGSTGRSDDEAIANFYDRTCEEMHWSEDARRCIVKHASLGPCERYRLWGY
jgi:hypothetical protein